MDTLVAILERDPPSLAKFLNGDSVELQQLQQLQHVVGKTLCKERSERYQTAAELLLDLKSVKQELDLALILKRQLAPHYQLRARREAQPGHESDAFASGSSASTMLASPAKPFAAQQQARRPQRHYVLVALIASALLIATVAGIFLYKDSIARRHNANAASVPIANATTKKLYAQMSEAEQLAFIGEQEQRISAMMGDRPVKLKEDALRAIKNYVDRYVARRGSMSDEGGREDLRVIYTRAMPYVPLIARSFTARKVPVIVGIYLPMIESEYKTCFENSIGAKGLFQFLPQTAKHYGVAHEDMCDVEKMTPAAAHYIADRMAELGDDAESMTLVLLSFNSGTQRVLNALRQLRDADNYERNFWTLFAHRDKLGNNFSEENANYVPAFFAAAIIGENPQTFELQTPPLSTLTATSAAAKP